MTEGVGTLDELRSLGLDCELHLTEDEVIELDIEKDVVGTEIESILDAHDLDLIRVLVAEMADVLVNAEDFALFRGNLAPHEVANGEGQQIRRGGPVGVA